MRKFNWQIEATIFEIHSILQACEKANIHELGFLKDC